MIQNESKQPTDKSHTFKEAQRLSGSCPMIYTWNGREFEFITDVLGVAPLGASAGDGQYFPVDHDEIVQIRGESLVPRDGEYEIVFGQPQAPLLPRQTFKFQGRVFQFPPRTIPYTATVEFEVFGKDLFVVPDAEVVGFGGGGITIEAVTGPNGIATVSYLRPGRYQVEARTADAGRAHAAFTLTDEGDPRRVRLALK